MAKTTRTTISVPVELKARMDAVSEPVNWSAVACRAFERKLAEHIKSRGVNDMQDVIQRLQASKRRYQEEATQAGYDEGAKWAREQAEYDELRNLFMAPNGTSMIFSIDTFFTTGSGDAYCSAERFVFVIRPELDGDRQAARDFWGAIFGDIADLPQDELVIGFASGALDVWGLVQSQL